MDGKRLSQLLADGSRLAARALALQLCVSKLHVAQIGEDKVTACGVSLPASVQLGAFTLAAADSRAGFMGWNRLIARASSVAADKEIKLLRLLLTVHK